MQALEGQPLSGGRSHPRIFGQNKLNLDRGKGGKGSWVDLERVGGRVHMYEILKELTFVFKKENQWRCGGKESFLGDKTSGGPALCRFFLVL